MWRGLLETTDPEPCFLQLLERTGEIDDAGERHALDRAGRGLGERSDSGGRSVRDENHGESPKRGRRAQHSAEIVRVADAVEHDDHASGRCRFG